MSKVLLEDGLDENFGFLACQLTRKIAMLHKIPRNTKEPKLNSIVEGLFFGQNPISKARMF